jgi:hypothetical protein
MSIVLNKPQYQLLNEGLHDAGLLSVADKGYQDFGHGPKHMLELNFITDQLHAQTGQPLEIRCLCTASLHRKSKLYAIVTALLGTVPDTLNLDDLVGRTCQLTITNRPGKAGGVFSNIDAILPPARKVYSPPPTPPPAPRVGFPFTTQPTAGENFTLPATK